jgi:hypothetical protein
MPTKKTSKQIMVSKPQNINNLFSEIKQLIEEARQNVATVVNSATTILYWNIGKRINTEILVNKRAKYGKEVVKSLSQELTKEYGKGWSEQHIWHCLRFAETFPDKEILYALSRQLSWTHFRTIMYLNDELKREFYIQMTRIENWNTRVLNEKIDSMLFERTAISKKPEELIKKELKELKDENKLNPDLVFRDPYFLNFLGMICHSCIGTPGYSVFTTPGCVIRRALPEGMGRRSKQIINYKV